MVTISVQAFTPILGTLLLGTSEKIIAPARFAIVDLLSRMQRADKRESNSSRPSSPERTNAFAYIHNGLDEEEEDQETSLAVGLFHGEERGMFRQELLQSVIIGMSRLDLDLEDEPSEGFSVTASRTPLEEPRSQRPSPSGPDNPYFPPSSSQSNSPQSSSPASLSPSPTRSDARRSPSHTPLSPSHLPNTPHPAAASSSSARRSPPPSPGREWPEEIHLAPNRMEQDPSHRQDYDEAYEYSGSDARKAALGRLSSMSLMAAVTATGVFFACRHLTCRRTDLQL